MGEIIHIDTAEVKKQLGEMVLGTIGQTLNAMPDAEADEITQAHKYERTESRADTRAGHYHRKLMTKAGEVDLKIPKLRKLPFETAIIERYRRREESVEEALIEMYPAGVSVRRAEDITEALWGTKVSPGTISNLNRKVYGQIEDWRNRPPVAEYPYVYMDGIYLKKNRGGVIESIAILVAIGVNSDGNREVVGAAEGGREDKESRIRFLRSLKDRGLHGTRLIVGDRCLGLVEAIHEVFSDALYQRCMVHFMRNILCDVPRSGGKEVGAMLKAIFAREDGDACRRKAAEVAEELQLLKLKSAAKTLEDGIEEALVYTQFPHEHWLKIRSNNGIERLNREIRRRTNAVGTFPDGNSALMPVCAGLRHVSATDWGTKTYLNMKHLYELERDQAESNQTVNA